METLTEKKKGTEVSIIRMEGDQRFLRPGNILSRFKHIPQ